MEVQDDKTRQATACSTTRQCPTIGGQPGSLITHAIAPGACLKRQREFYHKCHRCDYRGKAADFVVEATTAAPSPNGNGVAQPNGSARNGA